MIVLKACCYMALLPLDNEMQTVVFFSPAVLLTFDLSSSRRGFILLVDGLQQGSHYLNRKYVCSVAIYQKYLTRLRELIIFRALARKLSFLPTELDIFDIRQHYVRILFIFQRLICWVLLFLTRTNMNLTVYGHRLADIMTS